MNSLTINYLTHRVDLGGTYFRYHNFAVALTQLGHKVTVFSSDATPGAKDREEIRDGILYRIIPYPYHQFNFFRPFLIDYPPCDVAHLFQSFLVPALVWQWIMPKRTKTLFYDWDDLFVGGLLQKNTHLLGLSTYNLVKYLTIGQIEKNFPKKATHVTTCSHFLADLAEQRKAKKVSVIPNGFWPFSIPDKQLARVQLGLQKDGLYFGYMGISTHTGLSWCLKALKENLHRDQKLRFAVCGPPNEALNELDSETRQRVDYLGLLPPLVTRDFAAALDVGLLALEDNAFNRSRFPIKFAEYLAADIPVLCSDVGECAQLSKNLPYVINAGKTYDEFLESFSEVVTLMKDDSLPKVDKGKVEKLFSWESIGKKLLECYYQEIGR